MTRDPRIDAYIAKAAPFAQPILAHMRQIVHAALPEVEEGIKWGMPHFMVSGKNVAGMAAFKAHCAFIVHGEGRQGGGAMGTYGKIAAIEDLPGETELLARLRAAAELVGTQGSAAARGPKPPAKPALPVPGDLAAQLAANPVARETFDRLAPSHRREYVEWITEAKRDETRARRLAQAIQWLAEGKKRNWKYEKC
jgi:uncharacterized protein YdeI (YjbR/CyaY-like superfamily)